MKRVPGIAGLLLAVAAPVGGAHAAEWGTVLTDVTSASLSRDGGDLISSSAAMDRNDNLVMVTYWEGDENGSVIRCIDVINEKMTNRLAECRAPSE